MFGLDAPKITRREFDGSDPQLQLAMQYAASKKSSPSTSADSSARSSVDEKRSPSTSSSKSASSLTKAQKQRFSFFKAAGTVLSLK
jgi:hypothetical protein